jgi:hypothetical protein
MLDDLYFIPILARALSGQPNEETLLDAFDAIEKLGVESRYAQGWNQFLRFMDAVMEQAMGKPANGVTNEDVRRADCGVFAEEPPPLRILIQHNEKTIVETPLRKLPVTVRLVDAYPGFYRIGLSTGWVLWEGPVTEKDLMWSRAFPGMPLRLAAATEAEDSHASREFCLLDDEVGVSILPGLESGSIELRFGIGKGSHDEE